MFCAVVSCRPPQNYLRSCGGACVTPTVNQCLSYGAGHNNMAVLGERANNGLREGKRERTFDYESTTDIPLRGRDGNTKRVRGFAAL